MAAAPLEPLKVAALAVSAWPRLAGMEHVVRSILMYLDRSGRIPLHEACSSGPIRLLDRVWEKSDPATLNKASPRSPSQYLRTDPHYHRYQFSKSDVKVVEDAALCGRLEILQYLLEYESQGDDEDPTRNAISWGGKDVTCAIRKGRLDIAQWLYENTPSADRDFSEVMEFAAQQGKMASIQWLLDVVYRPEQDLPAPVMNDAAAGGHMEILQWIYAQGYDGKSDHALTGAARNGRLDMVDWLVEHGLTESANEAVEVACGQGHLAIVRWLNERKLGRKIPFVMKTAIANGHLDVVKYLFAENTTFYLPSMMKEAAMHGHLHIIQLLSETYGPYIFLTFESVSNLGEHNCHGPRRQVWSL